MQWMPLQHLNQAVRFINTAAHSKPCSKTSVLASAELGWECWGTEGPLACPWSCTRDESQIYHQPFSVHGIPLFSGLRPLLEARRCSKDCRLITELQPIRNLFLLLICRTADLFLFYFSVHGSAAKGSAKMEKTNLFYISWA